MTAAPTDALDPKQAALDALARLTDVAPSGVWSSPGRVNLIGEHTDYNDGFVLPLAIPHRTVAAVAPNGDRVLRVTSTFADEPVAVPLADLGDLFPHSRESIIEWARYPLGVAWALGESAPDGAAAHATGLDIAIASNVPVGAGLSSSAAIEGAVAIALNDLWQLGLDRPALARAGRRAENEAVGAPTGIMDQMASILGAADAAILLDCRSLEVEVVDLGFDAAGLTLLVMDTRVQHSHASGGYGERRASCEAGAATLGVASLRDLDIADLTRAERELDDVTFRRVRHVVTENQRVLDTVRMLRSGGPRSIGDLLLASHASMRDDFEISVPELDTAVDAAVGAGAIGARMTGGGFGGAAIALVDRDRVAEVSDEVMRSFAGRGFAAPTIFPVTAADGARRES
ncbi:galactokinase [Microbacterium sp. SLBN-154]|uniref:galactokinase n=1 Tax=Microbacterium sp. SLBN-154 TaxID=2768458 RepID=UPI0011530883|nr:galactokinase [Microbacterium sp. SLBN-154]TQK20751.1 galactokinase [Microbacterium sp. SLBN-154]